MEVSLPMRDSVALPVEEPSQAGEARRLASVLADRAGFGELGRGKVALVTSELANNLARHARSGELILSIIRRGAVVGVEVLAVDRGPGMADLRRCLVDGYSTGGTPGTGLGAVARIADEFDAYSVEGQGSAIVARLWGSTPSPSRPGSVLDVGAVCLPVAGESESGDAWATVEPSPGRTLLMVADGLGHGPKAAEASAAAVGTLRSGAGPDPAEVIRAANVALRETRGAAVAVALVEHDRREVRFAGVGNIVAAVLHGEDRHGLVSHNGTVGLDARKIQEFTRPWLGGALLVMHSDGLATHWKPDRRLISVQKHPSVIAGVLYRDHSRGRDDVTVVVARDGGTTHA